MLTLQERLDRAEAWRSHAIDVVLNGTWTGAPSSAPPDLAARYREWGGQRWVRAGRVLNALAHRINA